MSLLHDLKCLLGHAGHCLSLAARLRFSLFWGNLLIFKTLRLT